MLSRINGQEKLFQVVFQYLFYYPYPEKPEISEIFYSVFSKEENEFDPFYFQVITKIDQVLNEVIEKIIPTLKKWPFDRLSIPDQSLLILGYVEYYYFQIPKGVVIDVAVNLSKLYSAQDDTYRFINGVLNQILC